MTWYYAVDGNQSGPVSEEEFQGLVSRGIVRADTLVWQEGMQNWQPYGDVTRGSAAPPPSGSLSPASGGVVCAECGQIFPPDEVVQIGANSVCAQCKPIYIQKLREGVALPTALEYAGFWIRFGAKLIDILLLYMVNMAIGLLMGFFMRSGTSDLDQAIFAVILMFVGLIINFAYGIFFLGRFGATPGKMACKIRVVMADGQPISYGRAAGRVFAEVLSGLVLYIGYIMVAFDEEKRALHDRIADTRVIRTNL